MIPGNRIVRVLNLRDLNVRGLPTVAIVDRTTKWGNPFPIGRYYGSREEVVERYRRWINAPAQADLREEARRELRGHDLACWCAPLACHADVLREIANG